MLLHFQCFNFISILCVLNLYLVFFPFHGWKGERDRASSEVFSLCLSLSHSVCISVPLIFFCTCAHISLQGFSVDLLYFHLFVRFGSEARFFVRCLTVFPGFVLFIVLNFVIILFAIIYFIFI